MARIRTIKPDFWKHEELSELAPEVHMLAAALLCYADDEGYFRANPKLVKAECCPLREDSVSVHDALIQLAKIGYVRLFDGSDGKRYGHIATFTSHQKINRPSSSKIKPLDTGDEGSVNIHGAISEPSPPEGNKEQGREQGTGKEDSVPKGTGAAAPDNLVFQQPSKASRTEFHPDHNVNYGPAPTEKEVFDYGKRLLGPKAGGLIAKLKAMKDHDLRSVRDILQQAEDKHDPREWIGAVVRGDTEAQMPMHEIFPPEIYRGIH